jgi:hypothetical protein
MLSEECVISALNPSLAYGSFGGALQKEAPKIRRSSPGTDGYSPLRQIFLMKGSDDAQAAELKSEADITAAEANCQLTTSKAGGVVNLPLIVWDGGKRLRLPLSNNGLPNWQPIVSLTN